MKTCAKTSFSLKLIGRGSPALVIHPRSVRPALAPAGHLLIPRDAMARIVRAWRASGSPVSVRGPSPASTAVLSLARCGILKLPFPLHEPRIASPAWLSSMNRHIAAGAPADVAHVAALVEIGVDPNLATRFVSRTPAPASRRFRPLTLEPTPTSDSSDAFSFLRLLQPGRRYRFSELVELASKNLLFQPILSPQDPPGSVGRPTPSVASSFGMQLKRIAQSFPEFEILGAGRHRRFILNLPT